MMNNRDYFTRPIQDSRSSHTYGHTNLSTERATATEPLWVSALVVLGFAVVVALMVLS